MKNFIVRTITAVFFVAAIVSCFLRAEAMILLFALVTGLTIWEFTGLVNDLEKVTVNRLISTVAGVYFFFAMAGYNGGITTAGVFIPYLISIIYMMVAELYLKHDDPVNDWAYTMMSQLYIALPFSLLNVLAFRSTGSDILTVVHQTCELPDGESCYQCKEQYHRLCTEKTTHDGGYEEYRRNGSHNEILHILLLTISLTFLFLTSLFFTFLFFQLSLCL